MAFALIELRAGKKPLPGLKKELPAYKRFLLSWGSIAAKAGHRQVLEGWNVRLLAPYYYFSTAEALPCCSQLREARAVIRRRQARQ